MSNSAGVYDTLYDAPSLVIHDYEDGRAFALGASETEELIPGIVQPLGESSISK